jgi:cysteine desulfurase
VLHACAAASRHSGSGSGGGHRLVPVTPNGVVDLDALGELVDPCTSVVSVMLANNEVGTIQPLAAAADVVRDKAPTAALHTDAVQAFPWVDVAREAAGADLVAVSAHKFGGPKGVGALVVRDGVPLAPIIHGGGQERDRRSGTYNVAGIVGMAAAMRATVAGREAAVARLAPLRDRLADGLLAAVPDSFENGDRAAKVAGNCHLSFDGVESEALLVLLDAAGVYAAAGSACTSGAMEPSHVLEAMGVPRSRALGALRLTLGVTTSEADVDVALAAVPPAVARLRSA